VLVKLLIRKGSVLKAKLHIAKRLSKARAITTAYFKTIINAKINIIRATDKDNWPERAKN
jgi:hypothetical protein